MGARFTILFVVTLLIAAFPRAQAACAPHPISSDQQNIILKFSDLRSAYLLRAGIVHYDESNRTPAVLRQQLQRHFDVVLTLLRLTTPQSIEIALTRLEAADSHRWTIQERTTWHEKLLAARLLQLQRLAAYRNRGLFPQNEGQSPHPVPIFVDRHNTPCAVGHLMRCSGWSNVVDAIQKSNNLIYVPDVTHSPIASWVLTSGLTLEEAALIQPGYPWPSGQFDASSYVGPHGSALQQGGLIYSHFQLLAENYTEPGDRFTPTGATPTISGLGLLTGQGSVNFGGFLNYTPTGTNWISIASANTQPFLHPLNASAATGQGQYVDITFNVATASPNQAINGITETSEGEFWQGFEPLSSSAQYYLDTAAFEPGATSNLAEVYFDQSTAGFGGAGRQSASFAPQQQFTIETGIWLENGVSINTFVLDFNVVTVPEPMSASVVLVLIAICGRMKTPPESRTFRLS